MTNGKRKCCSKVMYWRVDGDHVAMIGGCLLVLIALVLFLCFSAVPAGATEVKKPLTLLFFGCQDGYLKPCG
ncbi:MAG: hypothetical protein U9P37_05360 [Pseudomonadota bacterium]|nr:hypothetical protein [Pseudomonadota bacterium]